MSIFTESQRRWASRMESKSVCALSPQLLVAYQFKIMRKLCLSTCHRLEGGRFFSATLRKILADYHGVRVGGYSYGGCLTPGYLPRGTIVGRYSSVSSFMRVYRRNHPLDTLSQHPFFYNASVGLLDRDSVLLVEDNPLEIGNDVWIGHEVVIVPSCRRIGDGAVIGSGSIVTRDVQPYSIVAGNPAKIIRMRYPADIIYEIERSRWWELSLPEIMEADELLLQTVTVDRLRAFVGRSHSVNNEAIASGPLCV